MNWYDGLMFLYCLLWGGVVIGWSVEYFCHEKYIRGGIFMMCAIGHAVLLAKELWFT
jgi:hypothetical protein